MNNLGPVPAGIIINRPMKLGVAELFPRVKRPKQPEHAYRACEGVYLSANGDLLLQLLNRDKPMEGLRIFLGHAGWGPGQLEGEIARGDWTLARAESDAIFKGKSEHPWPTPRAPKDST